jgi:hypothetical protein
MGWKRLTPRQTVLLLIGVAIFCVAALTVGLAVVGA